MPDKLYDCVIFDLDGTLIDSRVSIKSAFEACVSSFHLEGSALTKAMAMIGQPLQDILWKMGVSDVSKATDMYRNNYFNAILDERAYEGIPELLKSLSQDFTLAVCTNKGHTGAFMTLDNNDLLDYFDLIYTIDDGPAKPFPEAFEKIRKIMSGNDIQVSPSRTLMVGDSPSDGDFAVHSGMDYAHVLWGFYPDSDLSFTPQYVLHDPFELFGILGVPMHLAGNIGPELDLHHFSPKDTERVVKDYLEEARKKRMTHVRIIHGKGKGVKREIVQNLLKKRSDVLAFEDAPPYLGGFGATLVSLKPVEGIE